MRILVLSNFYPPYTIGGMENRCKEVVDQLRERGHEVVVLTSVYGMKQPGLTNGNIYRLLSLESDMLYYRPLHFFTSRRRQERKNLDHLKRLLSALTPDFVFVWGMWNLSRTLPYYVEHFGSGQVIYSLANDWPAQPNMHVAYWQSPAQRRIMKPIKKLIGSLALTILRRHGSNTTLQFEHVICVSRALRDGLLQAGVPLKNARVIYPAIDLEQFLSPEKAAKNGQQVQSLSLLYAGNLAPHKGVHTAIEAISYIARNESGPNLSLTIIGSGHPSYEEHLRSIVTEKGLHNFVHFVGQVSRQEMPELLRRFDVLLFPSIWEEPFARIVLEAMAAGLVVIGTTTGGTKEILVDGVNSLTFEPEDTATLARRIEQLYSNPALYSKLVQNAQKTVTQNFSIERMVNEIEKYLTHVAGN